MRIVKGKRALQPLPDRRLTSCAARGHPLPMDWDTGFLVKLARAKMPFGKYSGRSLVNLPEHYVVWFANKGFPEGELGDMLRAVYEIKANGLEYLFKPLIGE